MTLTLNLTNTLPKPAGKKLLQKVTGTDLSTQGLVIFVAQRDDDKQSDDNKTGMALSLDHKAVAPYKDRIVRLIKQASFSGKKGETISDYALEADDKKAPLQLTLVGIGKTEKLNINTVQKIASAVYNQTQKRLSELTVLMGEAFTTEQSKQFALALLNASYRFDGYKSDTNTPKLDTVNLLASNLSDADLSLVTAVHNGQSLARDVANEPGNVCYPAFMAEQAEALAKEHSDVLKVTVFGEDEMQALGMNSFLAVAKGSAREGKLVIMEYQGKSQFSADSNAPYTDNKYDANSRYYYTPVVLGGKGVTFDSGGISIKPGAAMDEMKFDMGGSASVLGTMKALCEARLPINVVGALACAENMPSGDATRPGDIVKAMNGKTIEILNTDAEGRLVLADTLCYVQRYNPRAIIDVATLTGACVIALGHVRSAVYANDEDVLFELENASEQSGDLIWHMPLDDAYQSQLDSPIADMQNIGGRAAGSVTAACFLSRFVQDGQPWSHLDIAGTAWKSGKDKMGTGRPVPLFMQYLTNMADAHGVANKVAGKASKAKKKKG